MRFRRQTRMVGVVIAAAALVVAGCADKKGAATPSAYPTSSAYAPSSSSEVPTSVQSPADLGLGILPVGRINLEGRRLTPQRRNTRPTRRVMAPRSAAGSPSPSRVTSAPSRGAGIANGAQLAVDQHNARTRMPTRPRARRFAGQHGHRAQPGQTTRLHPGRHRRHRAHHLVGCGSRRPALQRAGWSR